MSIFKFSIIVLLSMFLTSGCGHDSGSSKCQADSCFGHGTCDDSSGMVLCQCKQGYDGLRCTNCAAGFHAKNGRCVLDNSCDAYTCSGHGSCDDSNDTLICICDHEYTGEHCDTCAQGYQDNDQDGTCRQDCETAGLYCNNNGTCEDESGTARCRCDKGYSGKDCSECSAGYHMEDQQQCVEDDTCQANSCNAHGTCDDSLGYVYCSCDLGYTSANCENCATGYQDNDEDGVCSPNCANASVNCYNHGQCLDDSGQAVCECDTGYAGGDCRGCDSQYQDNDGDGTCEQSCALVQLYCSGHGQCSDVSGTALCVCYDGFGGDDCSECAAGYHPDAIGGCILDTTCQANSCSNHGTCDDSSGEIVCDCGVEYTGENCQVCASGYQDNNHDGTCLANCMTSGLDCGQHGLCSDSSGIATCRCQDGYSGQGCTNCSDGFQDNDNDGTCMPACSVAGLDCSNHGQCSDLAGMAICICDEGYTGEDCTICAEGFQDNDGVCSPVCPLGEVTIYDIQNPSSANHVPEDCLVNVEHVIVSTPVYSAGSNSAFFAQEPQGGQWSGLLVYCPDLDLTGIRPGGIVDITGTITEYYGMTEIVANSVQLLSNTVPPDAVVVTLSDINDEGSLSEAYEGVLVKIESVTTTQTPFLGQDGVDHGDFLVADVNDNPSQQLVIGDMLHSGFACTDEQMGIFCEQDHRELGQVFNSITGVVAYSYSHFRIEPRALDDFDESNADFRQQLAEMVANQNVLSYYEARNEMFSLVDNVGGQVQCVYTGQWVTTSSIPDPSVMNTEHTWPRSQGSDTLPALSDLNHLFPVMTDANSTRSNYPFGEVEYANWSSGGSLEGYDASGREVFEPRDSHKGDVARAMFYFAVRYEKSIPYFEEEVLREWNIMDPPDAKEIQRAGTIEDIQGKRNPFVDHPEYADRIDDF